MKITIRKFEERDIPLKVKWINNPLNNKFLHYDLPLCEERTIDWFRKNKLRTDRYDATIEADGKPIGVIGLLNIDKETKKAEYYITLGEREFLGKGVAYKASLLLLEYAFNKLYLNQVILYTEVENIPAQRLFEKIGFRKEGLIKDDLFYNNKFISRFLYAINRDDFLRDRDTIICSLGNIGKRNNLFVKRDDLFPFSFGGNKARKGILFWEEIKKNKADYILTYGSSSSNHCRVISNIAASENIPCCIISPTLTECESTNKKMMQLFGAEIIFCDVSEVHGTIENKLSELRGKGYNPYFIQGGGHGNIGTQAYVNCYDEICRYERYNHIHFDYIFLASGTGTTQAGLICGKILNKDKRNIVGISIARKNPRGRDIVKESVIEFLGDSFKSMDIDPEVLFDDSYVQEGYGDADISIKETICDVLKKYGIPLDCTYTGKAFYGMLQFLKKNNIKDKNLLFIHTGGTPLFFDFLKNN